MRRAGGESTGVTAWSAHRRTIRRVAACALAILAGASVAWGASIELIWDANTEPDIAGYKVHYGLASGVYTAHLDVGKVVSKTVTGLLDGTTYYFSVTAYDSWGSESGYSKETSASTPPAAATETITQPASPTGPVSGSTGVAYTYTASGAVSNLGDAVQYRFSWSDGSNSGWLPVGTTSAAKTWSSPGTYTLVSVESRCAVHTAVVSTASPALTVTIASMSTETVSTPSAPSGPITGVTGVAYTYSTGGAVSSTGDPVEYRFSWSDGSVSNWLPAGTASASKTWTAPGVYTLVRAEARCSIHQTIVSSASLPHSVTIVSGTAVTVSAPSAPAGPASGYADITYHFTTGGAVSSSGGAVKYCFHWGDGTVSDWIPQGSPVTAWKSWTVPGTYSVQAEAYSVDNPSVTVLSAAVTITIGPGKPVSYALVTRSDTGQAALWRVDSGNGSVLSSEWLFSADGIGEPWQATSYAHVSGSEGYVLWSRGDTGQAVLWKVNPGTGSILSSSYLESSSGIGGPWLATSYAHVNDMEGYVLWSRSDTGQAILWRIKPGSGGDVIPVARSYWIQSVSGIGGPWQATSYTALNSSEGYVLWSRGDTGQATLWLMTSDAPSDTVQMLQSWWIFSPAGVGGPWQATSYTPLDGATGYVLWTRPDTGAASVWKVNPGAGGGGTLPVTSSWNLSSSSGVGQGWQATSYVP